MDQDNSTRLKEEFRFAAKGARCRSATFIDPNLESLGQREWMEAECANGRDWNIKILKTTDCAEKEMMVDQTYLTGYQELSFGAMVLKLVEYQQAQRALGFLADEKDTAALAGAPYFEDIAKQQGIVFNATGDPIAPVHGLVTQPGRYPISAFKAAYDSTQANIATLPVKVTAAENFPVVKDTSVAACSLSFDEQMQVTKIVRILNGMIGNLGKSGTKSVLSWGDIPFRSGYASFVKDFDRGFDELRKLRPSWHFIGETETRINLFRFHAFRVAGAWAMQTMKNGDSHFSDKRSRAVVEDTMRRCREAAQSLKPGAEVDMGAIMDFSKASRWDTENFLPDLAALQDIVAAIEAQANAPSQPVKKLPHANSPHHV